MGNKFSLKQNPKKETSEIIVALLFWLAHFTLIYFLFWNR